MQELKSDSAEFDDWGHSYGSYKRLLRPWKEQAFIPNLKTGDSVYESACGSGLNLLLTTEIAAEFGITNLSIYGNDYVPESVALANNVWKNAKLCVAASTNLTFVPSNSFDVAYTGYLDPLTDPLHLLPNKSFNVRLQNSIRNCRNKTLAHQEQKAQQDWYASWVSELVRIAKPNKVVIVESARESLCKGTYGWGGVDMDWWKVAIETYSWDVDPTSLIIQQVPTSQEWHYRYHVMMRKKDL